MSYSCLLVSRGGGHVAAGYAEWLTAQLLHAIKRYIPLLRQFIV